MVIDETQCQAVLDAEKRNKRKIVVTFNYRYAPAHQKIKEMLLSGEIGKVDLGRLQLVSRRPSTAPTTSAAGTGCVESGGSLLRPQGHPSLRSDQLVARRRPGRSVGARQPRRSTARTARSATRNCRPCPHKTQVPLLLRHDEERDADEALRRVRGRRRLPPRRLRVPRGRRHLRHDVGGREVLERRHDDLLAERVHAVRGLPPGVQRREGTARRPVVRAPAVAGRRTSTRSI